MIRSYLLIAWRNLLKNQTLSFINISGLAVGMTFTLLISLWIQREVSFDGFHQHNERIGMLMRHVESNGQKRTQLDLPLPLYDELLNGYPELENLTRLDWGEAHNLRAGENVVVKNGFYADPGFLKMFTFPLKAGKVETALKEPASIVLTSSLAKILFGDEDPMGQLVTLDLQHPLVVTGVLEDIPENSSLTFNFLIPFEFNIQANPWVKRERPRWGNNFVRTFVEVKPGVTLENFSENIRQLIKTKSNSDRAGFLFAHPFSRLHLYDDFDEWINTGGRIEYVRLFGIVGVLVLFIACINFMNLATARSEKRIKEVGIRKAVGSQRTQLVFQFLCESLLTALIAFCLSIAMTNLALPFIHDLGFGALSVNNALASGGGWLLTGVFAACVITGLLAGSYPALYLSSFIPVKALKGVARAGTGAVITRKVMVVMQFTICTVLLISTIVVYRQIQHAKSRPLGYDPNGVISLGVTEDLKKNFPLLKQELMNTGFVESVSKASSPMTAIYSAWTDFSWSGKDPNTDVVLSVIMSEYDYEKTNRLTIVEGRAFSPSFSDSASVMLNQSAVNIIGFQNPIGETINFGDEKLTVVGVVQDVVMTDPYSPVRPAIYMFDPDRVGDISLRLKTGTDVNQALADIEIIAKKYNPAYPFSYTFVADDFEKKFVLEAQVGKLAGVFALLAIFISCLGLFGLVTFMAEQRTKEIGVRKVLGASVLNLWRLLSVDFTQLVIISIILAVPVAWYFLEGWLSQYQYRTDLSLWIFAAAGVGALLITVLTVSFQAIKAAMANPVKSLRSE
jgi:putative ABC transport system permease protein